MSDELSNTPAQNDAVWDRTSSCTQLDKAVTTVDQVSPARAKALEGMGISTVRDLVTNYPRRYLDLSHVSSIGNAKIGESYTIKAQVYDLKSKRPRPNLPLTEICLVDGSGTLIVTMFHMPWITKQISPGMMLAVAGKIEFNYGFKRMTNPMYEVISDNGITLGRVLPVHPVCEKISVIQMRRYVQNALDDIDGLADPIPIGLRLKHGLMSRARALRCVHFPASLEEANEARRRIAFEEILFLQLRLGHDMIKRSVGKQPTRHVVGGQHQQAFLSSLSFTLTDDQQNACADLNKELQAEHCANHLLLGDVGTGKTACAGFALAACADTGTQAFLIAPTEVLAQQHAQGLGSLFDTIGVTWELLTGSTAEDERARIVDSASVGNIDVLIGTHALLEDDVKVPTCSLVIIDEQQRFGVEQRKKLIDKGPAPDVIYLTATPIPRTLAMATLGTMTFSYLSQKPKGTRRETHVLHRDLRGKAYDAVGAACKNGRQAFIICPLVGEQPAKQKKKSTGSKKNQESGTFEEEYQYASISIQSEEDLENASGNVTAATNHAAFLQNKVFFDYKVGLLHGKMSAADKDKVMEAFRRNEIQVLVSTTVIEVGVDVPNATVMIVEDADRFGLSQLHQLRGRVGRGDFDAEVYLITGTTNQDALTRLKAMETTEDGLQLAAYDLSLRREGDILGNRQSGTSTLKLVNISRDAALIEAAHADAIDILSDDPTLEDASHFLLARECRMLGE